MHSMSALPQRQPRAIRWQRGEWQRQASGNNARCHKLLLTAGFFDAWIAAARAPEPAKKAPQQSSRSKGPLDAFTAATRLNSASMRPLGSPANSTLTMLSQCCCGICFCLAYAAGCGGGGGAQGWAAAGGGSSAGKVRAAEGRRFAHRPRSP